MGLISNLPIITTVNNDDLLVVEEKSTKLFKQVSKSNLLAGLSSGGGNNTPTSPTAITSNLILDLYFTERTGQVISDNSGNNFNGIAGNSSNTDFQDISYPSWINSGIEFNGDDYVYLPASNYFNGNFSVEIVFYQRNFDAWARLFDFGNGAAASNILLTTSWEGTGRLSLDTWSGNNSTRILHPLPTELYKWHYYTFTLDGNVGRMFKDCSLVVEINDFISPSNVIRNNCYLGRSNWSGDAFYNGLIGLFRIYNRTLTTTERIGNYNQSKAWLASKGIIL